MEARRSWHTDQHITAYLREVGIFTATQGTMRRGEGVHSLVHAPVSPYIYTLRMVASQDLPTGCRHYELQSNDKQEERKTLMQASHQKQNTCPHELTQGLYSTSKHIGHFQSSDISVGSSMAERTSTKQRQVVVIKKLHAVVWFRSPVEVRSSTF